MELLAGDVGDAEQAVARLVKVELTQGQFDALVDFVFNLGQGQLAESTLLKELNSGQDDAAGEQLLRWDHAGTQENAGLKARREAEFQLGAKATRCRIRPPKRRIEGLRANSETSRRSSGLR